MCGRYAITSPPEAVRDLFGYPDQPNFPPRYNIAPTQPVPVVRFRNGAPRLVPVRWGLVSSWAREVESSKPLINARGETVFAKPSFRAAIRRRRCLFPADGFYEWRRAGERRQPFLIRRADGKPFAMAGIWEHWTGRDGSELESAAIITTAANATLHPIHHRMLVILGEADFDRWLIIRESDAAELGPLLAPVSGDLLEAVAISDRVNRVANDDADIQRPAAGTGPAEKRSAPEDPQMKLL